MGGFMWALRWVAAVGIFANCLFMTVEAELESRTFNQRQSHPPIARVEVRWAYP